MADIGICPKCGRTLTVKPCFRFGYTYMLHTCMCGYGEETGNTGMYSDNGTRTAGNGFSATYRTEVDNG